MSGEDEVVVVMVSCPTAEVAASLASALVGERLAACGNILPGMRSIYRWQGAIQDDPEALLLLKTHRGRVDALNARVAALHPYQVPEAIALPVVAGLGPYLTWVTEQVTPLETP